MAKWLWRGTPIEELTREELVEVVGELAGRYWRVSDLYHDQCEAMGKMMSAALEEWPRQNRGQP